MTVAAGRSSLLLGSLALLLCACATPTAKPRRPNIILIVSDDHAAHALSCYGGTLDTTPALDRLAGQGARLTNAFVTNALCGPSRACILTGKYSHVNGFRQNEQQFDGGQWHVAKELRQHGYTTAAIGKWHLGTDPTGFDHWHVLPGQGRYVDPVFVGPGGRTTERGYATDLITDHAIAWLQSRPADQPFFLFLGHKAPHRAWVPPERLAAQYRARTFPEPPTLFDDWQTRSDASRNTTMTVARHLTETDVKGKPPAGLSGEALTRWNYQRYMQDYLACVRSMDENIGRLCDWLDAHGLADDTIVVYTADNGFFLGDHGFYDKRFMYEESLRVPLLIRWPGQIAAGSTPATMALNVDLTPTLLGAAGIPVPADVQGRDLLPALRGQAFADRRAIYYRYYEHMATHDVPAHWGVRTATHKLIWFPSLSAWELYDLRADPHELRNLADDPAHAAIRADLERDLTRLRAELGDAEGFPPAAATAR